MDIFVNGVPILSVQIAQQCELFNRIRELWILNRRGGATRNSRVNIRPLIDNLAYLSP